MNFELKPRRAIAEAVKRLQQATYKGLSPADFLALTDKEQKVFQQAMATEYPAGYAKLLALKIANLFVARYHFIQRHTALASSPIQLMLDPSNACQLQCPGCVHTDNSRLRDSYEWPAALLSGDCFEQYMRLYGPFAFGAVFYNYGEPLLNKNTPRMIRRAKDFLLTTSLSSNLSIPKIDVQGIVRSGLNFLYASLDGATQATYSKYRRRGELSQCLDNIRRIVETKDRLNIPVPQIEWNFLTFEHNVHEIELAIETGRQLGVHEVNVATPFAVDWDDPSVKIVDSPNKGRYKFDPDNGKGPLDHWSAFEVIDEVVEEAFAESWVARGENRGALHQESHQPSRTCEWLYQSITIDASGRIMPCCIPPRKGNNYVYGKFLVDEPEPFNAQDMRVSRLAFADRTRFEQIRENELDGREPDCASCQLNPTMCYSLNNVRADLEYYDQRNFFDRRVIQGLTNWSQMPKPEPRSNIQASQVVRVSKPLRSIAYSLFFTDPRQLPAKAGRLILRTKKLFEKS